MMKPLSKTIRWWHLLAVALCASTLIATTHIWRAVGRANYQKTIEALKTKGKPASIDDYIASAPPVDVVLQNDWDIWQQSFLSGVTAPAVDLVGAVAAHELAWDKWVTGRGPHPQEITYALATNAAQHAPAIRMLRHGGLVLSGLGWVAQDLPPGKRRMPFAASLRLSQLYAVRELTTWLRFSAVLADDPREHLADLDALHSAMQRPATLIDAMIAVAVGIIRDRTYGDLMLRERLPHDFKHRWLEEPSRSLALVGDGFEGESVLMGMATAAMIDVASFSDIYPGWSNWRQLPDGLSIWLNGSADCAIMIELETHVAQRLRGERLDPWPAWHLIEPRVGALGRITIPNLTESCITALQADALHRMARIAVRVINASKTNGPPIDQSALHTFLGGPGELSPAGDHLHLRYEIPAPGRFRLVIDPASPLPNFDDPGRMKSRTAWAGAPPAKGPLVWNKDTTGVIEVQLPPPATP